MKLATSPTLSIKNKKLQVSSKMSSVNPEETYPYLPSLAHTILNNTVSVWSILECSKSFKSIQEQLRSFQQHHVSGPSVLRVRFLSLAADSDSVPLARPCHGCQRGNRAASVCQAGGQCQSQGPAGPSLSEKACRRMLITGEKEERKK